MSEADGGKKLGAPSETRRFPIIHADERSFGEELNNILDNVDAGNKSAFLRALVVIGFSHQSKQGVPSNDRADKQQG